MTVDLSPEEIEILELWYRRATCESYGATIREQFALLEKLGIEADEIDLRAYKRRHPEERNEGR